MRPGLAIGIPLTLLQLGIHHHTQGLVDLPSVANNFLLGSAIYDADRIEGGVFDAARTPTRFSAVASSLFYEAHPSTQPLVPIVLGLHTSYTRLKPWIAPAKPFFVGAFWTLAVYYVPLLRANAPIDDDLLLPASFFLSISALSHAADVVDREDDARQNLETPAVVMPIDNAKHYSLALALSSAWLHTLSSQPFPPYDVVTLVTAWGALYNQTALAGVVGVVVCVAYVNAHDVELLSELLRSTEESHKWAIAFSTSSIELSFHFSEPYRSWAVKSILAAVEGGDAFGRAILHVFSTSILDRLRGL